jgi:hypothetical protein
MNIIQAVVLRITIGERIPILTVRSVCVDIGTALPVYAIVVVLSYRDAANPRNYCAQTSYFLATNYYDMQEESFFRFCRLDSCFCKVKRTVAPIEFTKPNAAKSAFKLSTYCGVDMAVAREGSQGVMEESSRGVASKQKTKESRILPND